jgi:hypothetical protein
MANVVHNLGLELPVYPPDTEIAWTKSDIEAAAQNGEPDFKRRTILYDEFSPNLKTSLRLASELLAHIAYYGLSGTVVTHEWALYEGRSPHDDPRYDSGRHRLIPDGYSLVAKVEAIKGRTPNDAEKEDLQTNLENYFTNHRHTKIHKEMQLIDITAEQCMLRDNTADGEPRWSLVDIDPRMASYKIIRE